MDLLLSDVKNGEQVSIQNIASSVLRVKLLEMGMLEGQSIRVLFRAPLGDPIAVDINGYILSLRKSEAQLVTVSKSETRV